MDTRTINITFLGPLAVEMNIYVDHSISLSYETSYAKFEHFTYGGPVLRKIQALRSMGYEPNLIGYVGRDKYGERIVDKLNEEHIKSNIQKIPGHPTSFLMHFDDRIGYSYLTGEPPNLDMWRYRINHIPTKGIIVIDPNIPSPIQKEVIKKYPLATIILRRPYDGDVSVFKTNKKLIILLNESDAFKVFSDLKRHFYSPYEVLYCSLLCDHHVVIEDHEKIYTLDGEEKTLQILKHRYKQKNGVMINNHFFAGVIAGVASQQNHLSYFMWGLICELKNHHNQKINKNEIIKATTNYKWKTYNVDRYGNIEY